MTSWRDLVEEKRQRQQNAIPKEWLITPPSEDVLDVTGVPEDCGQLTSEEVTITNTDVEGLLKKLASGEWTSVAVTTSFYKRAIIAQQLVNCLTEIFVERALARAAELDEHLKATGTVVGPLHGLPISLKDQLCIKGLETTMGYVSWIGKYAEKNAVLVDILLECGAVPFVRTNVPQTLMWPETFNNVFGRTRNPYNRALTSGGSSGGEGALLALKGSPLGIGSDIGGSIRIPAAFNGVYGLRPSYGRVPYAGAVNSLEGLDSILSVFGPFCNSMGGIKAFMKAVIASKPWRRDPLATQKKWSEEEYQLVDHGEGEQLCFGIIWNDGYSVPHPPIIRSLELVKKALLQAGHLVIDWEPLHHKELADVTRAIWNAASAEDYKATTSVTGEPVIDTMSLETSAPPVTAEFRPTEGGISAYQLWQIQKRKRDLRQEYLAHWEATVSKTGTGRPVDAIISPAAPYAAPPHGTNRNTNYTNVWNALDYTSCIFPVSKVDPAIDVKKPAHEFLNDFDRTVFEFYDPETFKNAPISLQLTGRTLEEEAVIAMTEIVDAAVKAANI